LTLLNLRMTHRQLITVRAREYAARVGDPTVKNTEYHNLVDIQEKKMVTQDLKSSYPTGFWN
jgi:hypothetical protein